MYIYIIHGPSLGLGIAVFDRNREQRRFKGASREHRGSKSCTAGESCI